MSEASDDARLAAVRAQQEKLKQILNSSTFEAEVHALHTPASDDDEYFADDTLVNNIGEQTYDAGPLESDDDEARPASSFTFSQTLVMAIVVAWVAWRGSKLVQLLQSGWVPDREL